MTIESLPDIPWNAHAALHSALEVIPIEAKTIVIWIDEEKVVRTRCNGSNIYLSGMCQAAIRDLLNS